MTASTQPSTPVLETTPPAQRRRAWMLEHRPFLIALGLAFLVRVLVQVAFMPAFVHSDGPGYLATVDNLEPNPQRPVGYVLILLRPLSLISDKVLLVALVQHLLGLATAVVLYLLMRRRGVSARIAMVATLPVLFDYLQLNLEHAVLSDVLFELLVLGGIAVLCWHRRVTPAYALVAGLILGTSVIVRLVGEPLILVPVVFCLLAGSVGWRVRVASALVAVIAFLVPIGAYAAWYHHERGVYAISEFGGMSLYLRTTTFVDCSALAIPEYQKVLCPAEPLGQRKDPTYYLFHDPKTVPEVNPPAGTTPDEAMHEFAVAAIRAQPLDYARTVLRDFMLNFDLWRGDRFEYDTAHKWGFRHFVTVQPTASTGPAYEEHGGQQLNALHPFTSVLEVYQWVIYLPGPLLFACLLVGLYGGLGLGRARGFAGQPVALILALTGAGLLLVPDLTAEFTWRYQLTAIALLPAAAALGYTAWRRPHDEAGTVATASTD